MFDGTALCDGESLQGIGYSEDDIIALIDISLMDKGLGTDLLLKLVVKESYGKKKFSPTNRLENSYRIIRNLNSENLSYHLQKEDSKECEEMLKVMSTSISTSLS